MVKYNADTMVIVTHQNTECRIQLYIQLANSTILHLYSIEDMMNKEKLTAVPFDKDKITSEKYHGHSWHNKNDF